MNKFTKILFSTMAILALLLCAGCDQDQPAKPAAGTGEPAQSAAQKPDKPAPPPKSAENTPQAVEIRIKVYYPDENGEKLVADGRVIKCLPGDKYRAAIESLMSGTDFRGQADIIPRQAKLNSVKVEGDLATVDFSREIVKNFVGGSTGEEMMIGSIVNTLTAFPEIKKVRILVAGQPVESIAGHMDLSAPLSRMDGLL